MQENTNVEQKPRFSIIVVDYDQSVSRDHMRRCLDSLKAQTYQNFEILLYHDGPKQQAYQEELNSEQFSAINEVVVTPTRYNDWGHSLRNMGIKNAQGDYIIHLNADNLLYPHALERLNDISLQKREPWFDKQGTVKNNPNILIFSIYMMGVVYCDGGLSRRPGQEDKYSVIFTGIPTRYRNIDCLQLVMKRELWLTEGGWHDRSRNSDGIMYPKFVAKYGARYLSELLGEHW